MGCPVSFDGFPILPDPFLSKILRILNYEQKQNVSLSHKLILILICPSRMSNDCEAFPLPFTLFLDLAPHSLFPLLLTSSTLNEYE